MSKGVRGNPDKLIPLNKRSKRVQSEIQEMGHKKNRLNWTQKKLFQMAVNQPITKEEIRERFRQQGYEDEQMVTNLMIVVKTIQLAVEGDLPAGQIVREMTGECPHLKLKQDDQKIKKEELKLKKELLKKETENGDDNENSKVIINVDF